MRRAVYKNCRLLLQLHPSSYACLFLKNQQHPNTSRSLAWYSGHNGTSKIMMLSSSNRPNMEESRYADVWEDTSSDSCDSPLPGAISFDRRPTEEFNRPTGGISAIARLIAAQRKQVTPNAKPSLLTALLKPSPIVEPLVSPTTTNDPLISPTNRPGTTRVRQGLESLRCFYDLRISAATNGCVPIGTRVLGASPAESVEPSEEDVVSPSTPPASLVVEGFGLEGYEYNQKYRPSIPDHDHQWNPIHESQPKYYAFPAYCSQEQLPEEPPISASPLFNSPTLRDECLHTRSDSAISGISLEGDTSAVAEAVTEAVTIPKSVRETLPRPPPLLRLRPPANSSLTSWTTDIDIGAKATTDTDLNHDQGHYEHRTNPSSYVGSASTPQNTADPASSLPSYCTHCVIPLTFEFSTSYLDRDENWDCCNCAAENMK